MSETCSWQDLNRCAKCGLCLAHCPVYLDQLTERAAPRGKIQLAKALRDGRLEADPSLQKTFAACLLCGACHAVCPGGMAADRTVLELREKLRESLGPAAGFGELAEVVRSEHNIADEDNDERLDWLDDIAGDGAGAEPKEGAEALFFVGCVGSFFPSVQSIPQSVIRIFRRAGVEYSLLGGGEWCCGFPLLGAGLNDQLESLITHNLEAVKRLRPQCLVFSCPSCLRMWKSHYKTDIPLLHTSQFLDRLIGQGRLGFKPHKKMRVTYHDPCDLGRHGGDFETPRRILRAIPGVELVEMEQRKDKSRCCGGGGNLEMADPALSRRLSGAKMEMVRETGARTVVTACQQCVRTMAGAAVRNKLPIKVMDLTELVLSALDDAPADQRRVAG